MNETATNIKPEKSLGLVDTLAKMAKLNAETFAQTVRSVALPQGISKEQFTAFLMVCHEHRLNPITREIYGFEAHGKIQPIVSIDGWLKIINSRPEMNGMKFKDHFSPEGSSPPEGVLTAITCTIYRSDREHPYELTEYMSECKRNTETWKNWPARMLRHKATIQCARYAFGFAGIYDPDEGARIAESGPIDYIEGEVTIVKDESESATDRLKREIQKKTKPASEIDQPEPKDKEPPLEENAPYIDPETGEVVPDDVGMFPFEGMGDLDKVNPEAVIKQEDKEPPKQKK